MRGALAFGSILFAAGLLALAPARAATEIGVTSAVVPAARGTPTDAGARVLQVGLDITANERVQTDAGGKAHLLFLDGSALSIGPNSDLVLDEYVYDPETRTGKIALSATRGVFRLVGGAISKANPVLLRTPQATVGVRGGIATVDVDGDGLSAAFVFGEEMTVEGGGETQRATRPGFSIQTGPNGTPQPPQPLTQEMVDRQNAAFEGGGGTAPGAPDVTDEDVANTQVSTLNSTVGLSDVAPAAGGEAPPPPAPPADETTDASQDETREQAAMEAGGDDGGASPGGGGGDGGTPGGGDDVVTPPTGGLTLPGAFVGRIKHATVPSMGTDDGDPANNVALTGGTVANGQFSAQAGAGSFVIDAADGTFAAMSTQQPFGPGVLSGGGLLAANDEFLLYRLTDLSDGHRVIAFAGVPTPTDQLPPDIWRYFLIGDFVRGQTLPFIDDPEGPVNATQAFITWGDSPGANKFGAGAVAIIGQGAAQQSAFSVLFGDVLNDSLGRPHISGRMLGQRRGGSAIGVDLLEFFSSPVASSDAGDGSDFFGLDGPENFVLEAAQVDALDNVLNRGGQRFDIADASPSVYFPNTTALFSGQIGDVRTTRTLHGFAGGLEVRFDSGGGLQSPAVQELRTLDPMDVVIDTDLTERTVSATFALSAGEDNPSFVSIQFGGPGGDLSAFIDDGRFFALNDGTIGIGEGSADGDYALITSHALQTSGFLPSGVTLCACEYMVSGFFSGRRPDDISGDRELELAHWVAGELSQDTQITNVAPQIATYEGHVIAGVYNNGALYQAAGGISLTFSFGDGNFDLTEATISNFDGATLTGTAGTGGGFGTNVYNNQFPITGNHPNPTVGELQALIDGSFFGPGTPPENTGGAVQISNDGESFLAQGTYAAELSPP